MKSRILPISLILSILFISGCISPTEVEQPTGEGAAITPIPEPAFTSNNIQMVEFNYPSLYNPRPIVNINMPENYIQDLQSAIPPRYGLDCYVIIDLKLVSSTPYTYPSNELVSVINKDGQYIFHHTESIDRTKDHEVGVCCEDICVTKIVKKL